MYQTEIEFDLFYRMSKKVNSLSNCTYVFFMFTLTEQKQVHNYRLNL